MARIMIPTPLRQFADKHDTVEVAGSTVGEVLAGLTVRFPDRQRRRRFFASARELIG